jgi:hypothetical protein
MDVAEMRARLAVTRKMVGSEPWQLLTQDWTDEIEAIKAELVWSASEPSKLGYLRGRLSVLTSLAEMPKLLDAVEQQLDGSEESDE